MIFEAKVEKIELHNDVYYLKVYAKELEGPSLISLKELKIQAGWVVINEKQLKILNQTMPEKVDLIIDNDSNITLDIESCISWINRIIVMTTML